MHADYPTLVGPAKKYQGPSAESLRLFSNFW